MSYYREHLSSVTSMKEWLQKRGKKKEFLTEVKIKSGKFLEIIKVLIEINFVNVCMFIQKSLGN